jgi:TPR repeat protein
MPTMPLNCGSSRKASVADRKDDLWGMATASGAFQFKHLVISVAMLIGVGLAAGCQAVKTSPQIDQAVTDANRNYALGCKYFQGDGVPRDYAQAVVWLRRAAELGHARAQLQLGVCYADGLGLRNDAAQAVAWFRTAAEMIKPSRKKQLNRLEQQHRFFSRDLFCGLRWCN